MGGIGDDALIAGDVGLVAMIAGYDNVSQVLDELIDIKACNWKLGNHDN